MIPLVPILLSAASDLLVPSFKQALQAGATEVTGKVVDAVAEKLGVPASSIPQFKDSQQLKDAIVAAEPVAADILAELNKSQDLMNQSIGMDYAKSEWWAWGWRPAWMWMLGLLWTYVLIGQPIVKAALLPALQPVDVSLLLAVSSIFMTFYMGGHTAKQIFPGGGRG